jgi:hypothetical protein
LALESGKQRVAGAAAVFAVHRKLPDINAGINVRPDGIVFATPFPIMRRESANWN